MGWISDLEREGWILLERSSAKEVAARLGRPSISTRLQPKATSEADPWSHSGVYGFGQFPWHTDGALSSSPPRWLLLRAIELSGPTWTELLLPDSGIHASLRRTTLRATDREGGVRYLPAVVVLPDGGTRLRWDPRICKPQRGLKIEDVELQAPTVRVEWKPERLLVIDNFRALHRRPAVQGQTARILERTYVWDR